MYPLLTCRRAADFQHMSQRGMDAIVAGARALQRDAGSGGVPPLLRGRYIGLMSDTIDNDEARLFTCAATELGARVAHIVPTLSDSSTEDEVRRTARMLGRLYDAVACQDTAHDLVEQLADAAGVPIYEGISSAQHPTARLADLLDGDWSTKDKRKFVIQALLVGSIP
jgi:ornithine carbamoyltransferase